MGFPAYLSLMEKKTRAIFLDRDGVINVDTGYPHKIEDCRLIPGAAAAIRRARDAGYMIAVVTNQGGIALGYYDEAALLHFNVHLARLLEEDGAVLDAISFCPHHPSAPDPALRQCSCRKPLPGMLLELAEKYDIAMNESAMIGDRITDLEAGEAAGVRAFLFDGGNLDEMMRHVLARLDEGQDG